MKEMDDFNVRVLEDMQKAAARELKMRERVYPGLVARSKMTLAASLNEIERMRRIDTYLGLQVDLLRGKTRDLFTPRPGLRVRFKTGSSFTDGRTYNDEPYKKGLIKVWLYVGDSVEPKLVGGVQESVYVDPAGMRILYTIER